MEVRVIAEARDDAPFGLSVPEVHVPAVRLMFPSVIRSEVAPIFTVLPPIVKVVALIAVFPRVAFRVPPFIVTAPHESTVVCEVVTFTVPAVSVKLVALNWLPTVKVPAVFTTTAPNGCGFASEKAVVPVKFIVDVPAFQLAEVELFVQLPVTVQAELLKVM